MGKVFRTRQAEEDLLDIWSFIAEDNPVAAESLLREINSVCRKIADLRLARRPREELSPNLRSLPIGNYVIYYRPQETGLVIIRVVHGARDTSRLF